MAKLYFRYAAMNAGKSTQVLQVRHNYHERHQTTLLLKPSVDIRDGNHVIRARVGLAEDVDGLIDSDTDIQAVVNEALESREGRINCILIDEAQFLTPAQVEALGDIADFQGIPVMCFGLRSDFQGQLFPGSSALMARADNIEELKTICWCGRKATHNGRLIDGEMVSEGPQVYIGGNESYIALCRKHWRLSEAKPKSAAHS
jgi:thymidine kinase